MRTKLSRQLGLLLVAVGIGLLAGCSGGNSKTSSNNASSTTPPVTSSTVVVTVIPATANLNTRQTRLFTALVGGTSNVVVTWSVEEGPAGGTVNSNGGYTAPTTFGTFHLIATTVADSTKSAMATITVNDFTGSFTPTGDMRNVSGIHTATLLPDGSVLVAGGSNGWTEDWDEAGQQDAEIYDPIAGTFTTTGNMISPRSRHTQTLLPNGRVLLTGGEGVGFDQPPVLASAELYDPGAGRFSPVGTTATVRMAQTATLLPNGKVLIAGGGNSGGWGFPVFGSATASAEIYDPSTNSFTTTGSMNTPRFAQTATLLPNGKVLIAGGFSSALVNEPVVPLASTEIYDPATGVFTLAGNMLSPRGGHTATLLPDGSVLITGGLLKLGRGWYWPPSLGSSVVLSSAELLDPVSGESKAGGNMTVEREEHTATLLPNGQVLIVGGATGSNGTLDTVELYDPAAHAFVPTAGMSTPRSGHSATFLLDGRVLVTGGHGAGGRFDTGTPGYAGFLHSAEILNTPR